MRFPVIGRLIGYALPFRKKIVIALVFLILATTAELSGPFIAKIAIDRHIMGIERPWQIYTPENKPAGIKHVSFQGYEWVREDWLGKEQGGQIDVLEQRRILQIGERYYLFPQNISFDGKRTVSTEGKKTRVEIERDGKYAVYNVQPLTASEVWGFYQPEMKPLFTLVLLFVLLLALAAVFSYIQLLTLHTVAQQVIQRLRAQLFAHLQKLPISYFDGMSTGQVISRVSNDTEALKELYVGVLASFVQNGTFMLGILVAMYILNPLMGMLFTAVCPVIILLIYFFRRYSSRNYAVIRGKLSDLNGMINEMVQAMPIIQAFLRERQIEGEFEEINGKYYRARIRQMKLDSLLLRPAVDLLSKIMLVIVLWNLGESSLRTAISLGMLYAFVDYIGRFFEPVNMIMERMSHMQQALTSAERVFQVLDQPVEKEAEKRADVIHSPTIHANSSVRPAGHVVFNGVWFAYRGDEYVLKDISFEANPGETIGIVGHTGSGKSSLINLLFRFYEVNKGQVSIDGRDIRDYSPVELRKQVGLVQQHPFLFTGDILFNIRLYNDEIKKEQVVSAAQAVQADNFIRKLAAGYGEPVMERGSTLSAGQRQLISFARTLAYDPAILVLDEATAHIDSETEGIIKEALDVLSKGRTTFIIAHRLSTIKDADRIIVLRNGVIVESGTHLELMKHGGAYHKMYQLQQGSDENVPLLG